MPHHGAAGPPPLDYLRLVIRRAALTLRANFKLSSSLKAAAERGARLIRGRSPRPEARRLVPGPAPRRRRRSGHNGNRG
jgi:hypothetical protein